MARRKHAAILGAILLALAGSWLWLDPLSVWKSGPIVSSGRFSVLPSPSAATIPLTLVTQANQIELEQRAAT
jgi:hypothetical protein